MVRHMPRGVRKNNNFHVVRPLLQEDTAKNEKEKEETNLSKFAMSLSQTSLPDTNGTFLLFTRWQDIHISHKRLTKIQSHSSQNSNAYTSVTRNRDINANLWAER